MISGSFVIDGEIVAVDHEGRVRLFQALQGRLRRAAPDAGARAQTKIALVAYDLLADDRGPLLGAPFDERRTPLEALLPRATPTPPTRPNPLRVMPTGLGAVDAAMLDSALIGALADARSRAQEGLILKRRDALFDGGRRGAAAGPRGPK